MADVSISLKCVITLAVVFGILYVLISPLPEMDAAFSGKSALAFFILVTQALLGLYFLTLLMRFRPTDWNATTHGDVLKLFCVSFGKSWFNCVQRSFALSWQPLIFSGIQPRGAELNLDRWPHTLRGSMKTSEVIQAWKSVLSGRRPSLAIEITRECPLRCPGCYAYEDGHVGGVNLRQLQDKRGDDLVQGVLALVDEHRPLHLSLVGGDPLVRHREVTTLLPLLEDRGIHVQVVTSAFRQIPPEWARIQRLNIVVSIDGLQPDHD